MIYALLEKEAINMNKGKKPMFPLWLSPTQIRLIPVGEEYISNCDKFVEELNKKSEFLKIRTDIDDREESVSKKIRDAEKEWIPIIIVIGEKEKDGKRFTPRFRSEELGESNKTYSLDELHDLIKVISNTTTDEHFNSLLDEKGLEFTLGAMKHAYWRACKCFGYKPAKIEWMMDFYERKIEDEEMESNFTG